jgi:hypothetical protein
MLDILAMKAHDWWTMAQAFPESRLFHAVVVVGLSFAASGCGSTATASEADATDDSSAGAVAEGGALVQDAGLILLLSADAASRDPAAEGGVLPQEAGLLFLSADAVAPDSSGAPPPLVWPIFL